MVWTRVFCCVGLGAGIVGGVSAQVEDRDPHAATLAAYQQQVDRASPEDRELAALRQRIAVANLLLGQKNRELNKTQAELERSDPLADKLRKELHELEKLTHEARERLAIRLKALPEVQAIAAERQELIREIQALRRQERALMAGEDPGGADPAEAEDAGGGTGVEAPAPVRAEGQDAGDS